MTVKGTGQYEVLPRSMATVAINVWQFQILLTQRHQGAASWALPCASLMPGEQEEQTVRRCLSTEIVERAGILQIERLGIFFQAGPSEDHSLVILALVETGAPSDGAAWWAIDALPKLASNHASILVYAIKALRFKLSRTQNVLMLAPASLTLQEVRLLLSTLEQVIRNSDDHSTPVWA
jgi:ADP-ribose pyrophosphatase YjhB (NUDIX family)